VTPANPGEPMSFGGGTLLTGVSCTSPTACTAVGYYRNQDTYPRQFRSSLYPRTGGRTSFGLK
jgi:hypothetical protein